MKIFTLATFLLATAVLSSCNTFEGVGEDLQKGGRAIEDAAE